MNPVAGALLVANLRDATGAGVCPASVTPRVSTGHSRAIASMAERSSGGGRAGDSLVANAMARLGPLLERKQSRDPGDRRRVLREHASNAKRPPLQRWISCVYRVTAGPRRRADRAIRECKDTASGAMGQWGNERSVNSAASRFRCSSRNTGCHSSVLQRWGISQCSRPSRSSRAAMTSPRAASGSSASGLRCIKASCP